MSERYVVDRPRYAVMLFHKLNWFLDDMRPVTPDRLTSVAGMLEKHLFDAAVIVDKFSEHGWKNYFNQNEIILDHDSIEFTCKEELRQYAIDIGIKPEIADALVFDLIEEFVE